MVKFNRAFTLCIAVLAIICYSCSNTSKKDNPETVAPTANPSPYPSLSNEELTKLYSISEKVDMIFYNLPMSINQDDASSAKNTVLYVSPAPAIISSTCKPLGRLSWLSQGVIVTEADIYSDTGCQYFLFMKNNQPVAANAMSESGVVFFNQIISQAQQQQK